MRKGKKAILPFMKRAYCMKKPVNKPNSFHPKFTIPSFLLAQHKFKQAFHSPKFFKPRSMKIRVEKANVWHGELQCALLWTLSFDSLPKGNIYWHWIAKETILHFTFITLVIIYRIFSVTPLVREFYQKVCLFPCRIKKKYSKYQSYVASCTCGLP